MLHVGVFGGCGLPIQPTRDDDVLGATYHGQVDGEDVGGSSDEMLEPTGQPTAPVNDVEAVMCTAPAYCR